MSDKHKLRILYHDQKGICFYCGGRMTLSRGRSRATIDHRKPRSRDGGDEPENLVAACLECNSIKAAMSETEFLAKMRRTGRWDRRKETRGERRVRMLSTAIKQMRLQARQ